MHSKKLFWQGPQPEAAGKAIIMLHGRGASAEDIFSLSQYLDVDDFSLVAPEATNNTWYPFSFLAPPSQNEPWLSSALSLLAEIVSDLMANGVGRENIFFLGFSQGACLTLEFVARNAAPYGGVVAFTGGLIGQSVDPDLYKGSFENTPVFIGTSDPDPHVPVGRVRESSAIFRKLGATVTEKIYPNMGHTISADEIEQANTLVFNK